MGPNLIWLCALVLAAAALSVLSIPAAQVGLGEAAGRRGAMLAAPPLQQPLVV
jgi:hypothetical protein